MGENQTMEEGEIAEKYREKGLKEMLDGSG